MACSTVFLGADLRFTRSDQGGTRTTEGMFTSTVLQIPKALVSAYCKPGNTGTRFILAA